MTDRDRATILSIARRRGPAFVLDSVADAIAMEIESFAINDSRPFRVRLLRILEALEAEIRSSANGVKEAMGRLERLP